MKYHHFLEEEKPSQIALDGYLWCLPGQRNTLSGFISFYNQTYNNPLVISTAKKERKKLILLKSPNNSKARRKQLFIQMLRELKRGIVKQPAYTKENILRISIEYLHDIEIPKKGIKISFLAIKLSKEKHFIRFARREFYLPDEVIKAINLNVF